VVAVLLTLAGCGTPAPATLSAEKDASTRAYVLCLREAAKRLDDHKSDAATIAQAALSACPTEFRRQVEAYSRGLGPDGEESLAAKLQSDVLGEAVQIVLQERKAAASPAVADPVELGAEAALRGDYATALRLWRPLADQGNAEAQQGLGTLYDQGYAVPQNYAEADRWFRKAAEQGDGFAQYFLGANYFLGHGVPKDYVQAYMWLNLAVAGGDNGAVHDRDLVALSMTPEQIAEAQRKTAAWQKAHSGQ